MIRREITYIQLFYYILAVYFLVWMILALIIICNSFHVLRYDRISGKAVLFSSFLVPSFVLYIFMKRRQEIDTPMEFLYCMAGEKGHARTALVTFAFCMGQLLLFVLCGRYVNGRIGAFLPVLPLALILEGLQETGLRGFLAEALNRELSFGLSAVLTGTIWGVLYLPLFMVEGAPYREIGFLFFLLNCVFQSIVLNALYLITKSIAACVAFRTFWSAASFLFGGLMFTNSSYTICSTVEMILIFSLVLYEQRRQKKDAAAGTMSGM